METTTRTGTPLRHRMIDDMRMRKMAEHTQEGYIRAVRKLAAFLGRSPDGASVEDLRRFQLHLVDAGTGPVTALGMTQAPPGAQPLQQHRAEHGVAVLASLALLDAQRHALAVDVGDLECDDLAHTQARAVGHRQRCLVLQVWRSGDQLRDLLAAQDHRQRARHAHVRHLGHQLGLAEGDVEEELVAAGRILPKSVD